MKSSSRNALFLGFRETEWMHLPMVVNSNKSECDFI